MRTGHLSHEAVGCQAAFEDCQAEVLGFNAKPARAKRWNSVTQEVVYLNAVTGELWTQSLAEAAERFFDDSKPASELSALVTRETVCKDPFTGWRLRLISTFV